MRIAKYQVGDLLSSMAATPSRKFMIIGVDRTTNTNEHLYKIVDMINNDILYKVESVLSLFYDRDA